MTFSNPCSAVLTPEELTSVIEEIFEDPLAVMTDYVGFQPRSEFAKSYIIENVRIFENIDRLCNIFIDSLDLLNAQKCSIPRSIDELRAKSIEEKKLYRVLSSIFSSLIITKIFFSNFSCPNSQKGKKETCTKRLDRIFERCKNLDLLLIVFPLVLENFYQMSLLPHIYPSMHPVDQPEPFFCHLISKGALMFLNCGGCNYFHRRVGGTGITFLNRLKGLAQVTQELFNYSVLEINFQDLTTIRPWNMNPEASPAREAPLECYELEKLLTEEPKKRRKKKKPTGKRAPISTVQPTFLDEEQGMTPSSTASSSPHENNHWDGPLLDLDQTWRTEGSRKLVGMTDNKEKLKVLKRSHSAPPITKTTRESF